MWSPKAPQRPQIPRTRWFEQKREYCSRISEVSMRSWNSLTGTTIRRQIDLVSMVRPGQRLGLMRQVSPTQSPSVKSSSGSSRLCSMPSRMWKAASWPEPSLSKSTIMEGSVSSKTRVASSETNSGHQEATQPMSWKDIRRLSHISMQIFWFRDFGSSPETWMKCCFARLTDLVTLRQRKTLPWVSGLTELRLRYFSAFSLTCRMASLSLLMRLTTRSMRKSMI
mmetsp:Transcript_106172/g.228729  ORF Transcript_106172/g.228729 Transcript_106172/m.228729 type:complete len:224 (-) Transcript_106172:311-982(-)